MPPIVTKLRGVLTNPITSHHANYLKYMEAAHEVDGRGIAIYPIAERHASEWQVYDALKTGYRGFLPRQILLDLATAEPPIVSSHVARRVQDLLWYIT
ncbi:MAG: hypothetical protein WDN66_04330 [Candidatus Saccharibacteria bacterium]